MGCVNPYRDESGSAFPCGSCSPCRKSRVRSWMFRLLQEDKVSTSSIFVTLTYDTVNVPICSIGKMTLDGNDVTKWLKRYRKAHPSGTRIKYYLVGEYGPKTERPHYHAIIFNGDPELVHKTWKLGDVHIGDVSGASVSYCAGYISKPGDRIGKADWDTRKPKFSRMSKGLGAAFLTPAMEKYYLADLTRQYVTHDSFKLGLPRYYRKKIPYTDEQRDEIAEFSALNVERAEMEEYELVLEKYPTKAYNEFREERIKHNLKNEKFLNRKL